MSQIVVSHSTLREALITFNLYSFLFFKSFCLFFDKINSIKRAIDFFLQFEQGAHVHNLYFVENDIIHGRNVFGVYILCIVGLFMLRFLLLVITLRVVYKQLIRNFIVYIQVRVTYLHPTYL